MSLSNGLSKRVESFKELFKKYSSLERINFFTIERHFEKVAIEKINLFNPYNIIGRKNQSQYFLKMLTHKKSGSII